MFIGWEEGRVRNVADLSAVLLIPLSSESSKFIIYYNDEANDNDNDNDNDNKVSSFRHNTTLLAKLL